jgi:protein phosphatase 2C family protein 2/3
MGSLAVARALGDKDFKFPFNKAEGDFVTAEPFIAKIEFTPQHDFLIISCDGLW